MDWINEVMQEVNDLEEIRAIENGADPWSSFDSEDYRRQEDDEDLYY